MLVHDGFHEERTSLRLSLTKTFRHGECEIKVTRVSHLFRCRFSSCLEVQLDTHTTSQFRHEQVSVDAQQGAISATVLDEQLWKFPDDGNTGQHGRALNAGTNQRPTGVTQHNLGWEQPALESRSLRWRIKPVVSILREVFCAQTPKYIPVDVRHRKTFTAILWAREEPPRSLASRDVLVHFDLLTPRDVRAERKPKSEDCIPGQLWKNALDVRVRHQKKTKCFLCDKGARRFCV